MTQESYQGWTNYPTWNVKLWLDNDEFHYRSLAEVIPTIGHQTINDRAAYEGFAPLVRERVYVIRDYVEGYVLNNFDAPDTGMQADLYGWAIGQVNWQEIAASYAEDYPFTGNEDDDEDAL